MDGQVSWWTDLEGLYAQVRSPDFEYDAECLAMLALTFLVGHESAHVYRRHAKALEFLRSRGEVRGEVEERTYRRFAETDVDLIGTLWALDFQWLGFQGASEQVVPQLGYLRMSYAVTMLYALHDAHRKEIKAYSNGAYCHPVIRRQMFSMASHDWAQTNPENFPGWHEVELEGWNQCSSAIHQLNFSVFMGDFGKQPEGTSGYPVSALQYNVTEGRMWQRAYEAELVLYRAVRKVYLDQEDFLVPLIPPMADSERVDKSMVARAMAWDDSIPRTAMTMLKRHVQRRDSNRPR
ncbi:hypothetical protein [Streptomyces sp. NBC_01439]|uniref:hypothetical protein n=1 Tax=Streptomyces sp. NBC_01439 TaxID=2903867 RepID=UPI002E2AA6C5|nr:hypothetical protein [Streptomyces sp. NBC_01439]